MAHNACLLVCAGIKLIRNN